MRRTMSTISSAVSTTMKAVSRKPQQARGDLVLGQPGRSDGVGRGTGVVAGR